MVVEHDVKGCVFLVLVVVVVQLMLVFCLRRSLFVEAKAAWLLGHFASRKKVLVVMLMPNIAILTIGELGGDHAQQLGGGVL